MERQRGTEETGKEKEVGRRRGEGVRNGIDRWRGIEGIGKGN